MDTLLMIIFSITLITFIVLLTLLVVNLIRKKPIAKIAVALGASFWLAVISVFTGAILDPNTDSNKVVSQPETQEKTTPAETITEAAITTVAETTDVPVETTVPETTADGSYITVSESLEALPSIDTRITDILIEKGYSLEHASAIQKILNTVGIESLEIESMMGDPESGLNSVVSYPNGYTDRDRRFYFTTDNGILFYAGFHDDDLYDSEKGGYLKNYNDVHVPEKEVTRDEFYTLQELAEPAVRQYLNYPDTASFDGFSYRVGRSDENYQLLGNVTAKNALGVKETLSFSVWYVKSDEMLTIVGIAIDGVRVK